MDVSRPIPVLVSHLPNGLPTSENSVAGDIEGLDVLRVEPWLESDWLLHGFSTRYGGVSVGEATANELNLGFTPACGPDAILENRRRFVRAVAISAKDQECLPELVTLKQMHSSLVRRVGKADVVGRASMWGDGLVTDEPGLLLGIQTADCMPILIADRKRRAAGAFHAGWRGTLKGIVGEGVKTMCREFGSEPGDMTAAIGPGIGSCCFAVGDEVRRLFAARFSYARELFTEGIRLQMDLAEANRRQLLDAGLAPESVFAMRECTSCQTNRFFSYRAERGRTGRMMAVIGIGVA